MNMIVRRTREGIDAGTMLLLKRKHSHRQLARKQRNRLEQVTVQLCHCDPQAEMELLLCRWMAVFRGLMELQQLRFGEDLERPPSLQKIQTEVCGKNTCTSHSLLRWDTSSQFVTLNV